MPNILCGVKDMTSLCFIRHAEPDHHWEDDRTRPLTEEGRADAVRVTEYLNSIEVDCFISSPYIRSIDTIKGSAEAKKMKIITDERLRERKSGLKSNNREMFHKRWGDFDFHDACACRS